MTGYFLTWISAWFTFIRYFFLVGSSTRKNIYHIFSRKALILCSSFLVAKHTLEMLVWLIPKDSLKINSNGINHAWSSHDHKFFSQQAHQVIIVGTKLLRDAFYADSWDYNVLFLTELHNWWDPSTFHPYNLRFKNIFPLEVWALSRNIHVNSFLPYS